MSAEIPFVIGQWVCGPRFFGREAEIAEILGAHQRWLWIAGLRRIGKTSLLKQLDHLAAADPRRLPLFWDLQGVGGVEELGLTLTDALLDAEEMLGRRGISLEEVEDSDVFASLEKLRRALQGRDTELLLLCDEADELMPLDRAAPGLVARLWQAVEGFEAARVVLASSLRLCDFGSEDLVERFEKPRSLGAMTDGEARALLRQSPSFDERTVEALRHACGNHPMLLQIAAKRCLELGDLEEALRQVAADRAVQHLFAVDFALLAPAEQEFLQSLAAGRPEGEEKAGRRLRELGLIGGDTGCGLVIRNGFLAAWLRTSTRG